MIRTSDTGHIRSMASDNESRHSRTSEARTLKARTSLIRMVGLFPIPARDRNSNHSLVLTLKTNIQLMQRFDEFAETEVQPVAFVVLEAVSCKRRHSFETRILVESSRALRLSKTSTNMKFIWHGLLCTGSVSILAPIYCVQVLCRSSHP